MNHIIDSIFTPDVVCKGYLLHVVENSRHSNNKDLINFILYEATDNQVYSLTSKYLSEDGNQLNQKKQQPASDAEYQAKMGAIGNKAAGAASFVAGIAPMFSKRINTFGGAGWGMATGIAAGMVASGVASVVTKSIFAAFAKMKTQCKNGCFKSNMANKTKLSKNDLKVCIAQCQLTGARKILGDLQNQMQQCANQRNPEQCKAVLYKQAVKYRDIINKYEDVLKKEKLDRIKAASQMGNAPQPAGRV